MLVDGVDPDVFCRVKMTGALMLEAAEKIPLKTGGWVKMLTICNY